MMSIRHNAVSLCVLCAHVSLIIIVDQLCALLLYGATAVSDKFSRI